MDNQTPQNNEEKKEILVPPEPTRAPEIQPGFNSPILFKKEEQEEVIKEVEAKPFLDKKKTILLVIVGAIIVLVAIVSISQILVDSRFETYTPNDFQPLSPDDFVLSEEGDQESNTMSTECGGQPFVSIVSPEEGQVFRIGETVRFAWELCGISPSLFNTAMIDVYNSQTNQKEHTFSLHCIVDPKTKDGTEEILWTIPDFLEISSLNYQTNNCIMPVINFLNPYTYKLTVSYANNTYQDTGNMFSIEQGDYVYVAPTFEDYQITAVSSFDRSPFIDSSAPLFLREIISPSFFQAPPLFANFYRTYVVPNGPAYILDLRDGKAYPAPQTKDIIAVQRFSNLYITEEELSEDSLYQERTHQISWSVFNEETKKFNLLFKRMCRITQEGTNKIYTECIPEE